MSLNKSVLRAIDILDYIGAKKDAVTITELSKNLGIPKSSTSELLYTLAHRGFLEITDEENKKFGLGLNLFEAGMAFISRADLNKEARSYLEKAAELSSETIFMAVRDKTDVVYLEKVEGNAAIKTTATLGTRTPTYCTGLGKALLASYTDEKVKALFADYEFIRKTENTITNIDDLMKELELIRKRGFAIDNREGENEIFCVAAPVYGKDNQAIASISISCLAALVDDEKLGKISGVIKETALSISKRMGYLRNELFI